MEPNNDNLFLGGCGPDRSSVRSRSPEDNSSLLSASAGSLDSALNHSRDEEELKNLTMDSTHDEIHPCSDIGLIKPSISQDTHWQDEIDSAQQHTNASIMNLEVHNHRNSNESGFVSIRSSTQSVSAKVISVTSTTSTTTSNNSNSSISVQQKSAVSNSTAINTLKFDSNFDVISEQSSTVSSSNCVQQVKEFEEHTESHISNVSKEEIETKDLLNTSPDDVFTVGVNETDEEKPPLPEKTRKSSVRRVSTYDNVDETDAAELRYVTV